MAGYMTIELEIVCECADCGGTLLIDVQGEYRGKQVVIVTPCTTCIDNAKNEAAEEVA